MNSMAWERRSTFLLIFMMAAAFGAALLGIQRADAAFGISPPFLNADHLVPGVTYVQTVYLVQDQPTVDLPIKAVLTMPDPASSWVTIDKGLNFIIPAGTHQFPVQISVHIPDGTGLGKYSGNLTFTGQPSQSGQVSVALGANVAINLTVGSGIFEQFSVPLISFPDIEEGWNPEVYVKFENDGNIPESFDSATFSLFDQYDSVQLAYLQKSDGFPATPPFTTDEYTLQFPTNFHLGVGDYWGSVVFYQNGKVIASQKTVFHVLPAGSLTGTWGRIAHFISDNIWLVYVVGALILLLIIFLIYLFRRRRRSSR